MTVADIASAAGFLLVAGVTGLPLAAGPAAFALVAGVAGWGETGVVVAGWPLAREVAAGRVALTGPAEVAALVPAAPGADAVGPAGSLDVVARCAAGCCAGCGCGTGCGFSTGSGSVAAFGAGSVFCTGSTFCTGLAAGVVGDFCAGTRSDACADSVVASFTVTSLTVASSAGAVGAAFVARRARAGAPFPPDLVVLGGALAGSGRWAALRGRLRPVVLSSTGSSWPVCAGLNMNFPLLGRYGKVGRVTFVIVPTSSWSSRTR
ncbi:hypothetical protein [Dactylosporangium matsuzakiense]|uniref:hypothetical protein n=1 Tax=Dactylosporangium matsuzakiense TaxID=53360 RepID=UPI0021C2A486|nr:hypothetical protein [Dactylosporangium matsuzakiense]UWZ46298.1 hypothetical protein Dmats_07620 [Dactylosporangium matsuzakiense]